VIDEARSCFGLDTITDFTAGAGASDVVEFRRGIFADADDFLLAT
jgi:hypothetical protein